MIGPTESTRNDITALSVHGADVEVSYLRRHGTLPTLICLHGFGSSKEDYADLALLPAFEGRDLVLLDAPGFGESTVDDPAVLSIPFLVDVLAAACDAIGVDRFHLLGHSMGGLTALLFCQAHPNRVLSFIDIEGNLAPEDCFLSRQILEHPSDSAESFLDGFRARVAERPEYASRLYASTLADKVRPASVEPIFISMVDLSDNHDLMGIMAGLTLPRLFVYGEQNRHLSYLGNLPALGVEIAEIPFAGHFPMYSNPTALWSAVDTFISTVDAAT